MVAAIAACWFRVGRRGWIGLALAAAVSFVFLAMQWGYPLDAKQTERAFAARHPNLLPPIHCRAGHRELGGALFRKVYVCLWRNSDPGGFPVAVNDKGIVEEWP
jgi:hypothetical protein